MTAMTLSRDSLGGQNSHRRVNGARSSRALSTIFKRLRRLDREIAAIDRYIRTHLGWVQTTPKMTERRKKLDAERREVRHQRKGYARSTLSTRS